MNVRELVQRSFEDAKANAKARQEDADTEQARHRKRSQAWVEALATRLGSSFGADSSLRVFWRGNRLNQPEFRLDELLHDICVCRVGAVKSPGHKKDLLYIQEVLWQVESEFSQDSRLALIDFNKLVLGSAKEKLFVGSLDVRDITAFISVFHDAAKACSGQVFLALVPHPASWDEDPQDVQVWRFEEDHWQPYV